MWTVVDAQQSVRVHGHILLGALPVELQGRRLTITTHRPPLYGVCELQVVRQRTTMIQTR